MEENEKSFSEEDIETMKDHLSTISASLYGLADSLATYDKIFYEQAKETKRLTIGSSILTASLVFVGLLQAFSFWKSFTGAVIIWFFYFGVFILSGKLMGRKDKSGEE